MTTDYELLDAGDGRRLERFADRVVDRPAPVATERRRSSADWTATNVQFEPGVGWTGTVEPWNVTLDDLTFELRPTASGQVGVFPEQATNWHWLIEHVKPAATVLNLFAYTGGSTLAAAAAGATVVHVDSVRSTVAWARRNAELSRLADRPVKWLVDDAEAFVRREGRRGHRYDGIILDPPSYGHGHGRSSSWRLADRLTGLLEACRMVAKEDAFVLLTAHSEGIDADWLGDRLREAFAGAGRIQAVELELVARSGARLWLGSCARMIGQP